MKKGKNSPPEIVTRITPVNTLNEFSKTMEVRHKQKFWVRVLENIKTNIKAIDVWIFIAIITLIYVAQWFLFDPGRLDTPYKINVSSLSTVILTLIVIKDRRSVVSFLIFVLIAKFLSFIFFVMQHDMNAIIDIDDKKVIGSVSDFIQAIFSAVAFVINSVITIVCFVYIGFVVFSFFINYIDYKMIRKTILPRTRVWWFIILTIIETLFFYFIYANISNAYYDFLQSEFMDYVKAQLKPSDADLINVVEPIFKMMHLFISFAWFPTMLAINGIRKTDVFFGKNSQIYFATQVVFLYEFVRFYIDKTVGPDLYLPIGVIAFISAKLFYQIVIFVITAIRNYKLAKEKGMYYAPYKISPFKHTNWDVEIWLKRNNYRLWKQHQTRVTIKPKIKINK